ncbi:MAG: lytic transglycosylase domain-containing protein [Vulcanimicrobiota bacterium]
MAIFDRISAINMRMQQLQCRFNSSQVSMTPSSQGVTQASAQGGMPSIPSASNITFEQLLSTYQGAPVSGAGSASGPSRAPYQGSEKDFEGLIKDASKTHGVDEDLIRAVIRQESGFNPNAESHCGAMGMMQLMPETAKDLGVKNAWDARENVMGGVKYLKGLLDRFDGNITKALAGYNAGPGSVEKYGGVPPYAETQNYVKNILGMYEDYKKKS